MPDYIPRKDQNLLAWADNFSTLITSAPTTYGLTAANATALAGLVSTYSTALEASTNPSTRGGSTVLAKDQARVNMVSYCRQLARAVQGTLTVTNQQRYDLGLTVRITEPSPIPPPGATPGLDVVSVSGNTVRIRLHDTTSPTRRGRPFGVDGAAVFSFVGAVPPGDVDGWKFEGNTTRTTVTVTFPSDVAPGAKVWLTAFWFNPRAQSGPACAPVGTNLPGGAAMAA